MSGHIANGGPKAAVGVSVTCPRGKTIRAVGGCEAQEEMRTELRRLIEG